MACATCSINLRLRTLVRLTLDDDQPPASLLDIRHRDALDAMPTPLDHAPHLPGLPAPEAQMLGRDGEERDLPPAPRTRALRSWLPALVEPGGRWIQNGTSSASS
jgi:hypothetical protein